MKKMNTFMLLWMFTGIIFAAGAKVITLNDITNPTTITVDNEQMYITENAAVYIFSLKDFKLKKKFGRRGEGPQEFKTRTSRWITIWLQPEYILVDSIGRISFFSKNGDFMKEMKAPNYGGVMPIGKRFVAYGAARENKVNYVAISFYNPNPDGSNLVRGKEIYRFKHPFQPGKSLDPISISRVPILYTYDNKIFIDGDEGVIYVFDSSGKMIHSVKGKYEKTELTKERKNRYINFFNKHRRFERNRDIIRFPAYLPIIRHYRIEDKKIYVVTYKETDQKKECWIFNIDGKFLRKVMLPISEMSPIKLYPYTIKNNKLYHFVENLDAGKWELHITEIK
ncbi:MAG: hypothetical protein KAT34_02940 [Candidatus Aminicenantes bacterium]|nr:hypothetical protein [Candidatus Aminicenantes bacterium]